MASMDNDIVRRGYFNVVRNPRDGVLERINTISSRRHWVVLRKQTAGRSACLELYKNEDQADSPIRVIQLDRRTFKNVRTNDRKKAFILNLNDDVCMFQCTSRADMDDWCHDIQTYGAYGGSRTESTSSETFVRPSVSGDDFNGVPDDETFKVNLRKSNTIVFTGPCLLEILRDFENNRFHIALFTEEELPRLVVKWQIDHVRQYGSNQAAFKFESGRKSSTGVDWFVLDTDGGAAARIHRAVDYWAKHIVEQVSNRGGDPRRSTLPGQASTPVAPGPVSSQSRSLPRPDTSISPTTHTGGMYQALIPQSRDQGGLYESPDRPPKGAKNKNFKAATKMPPKPPAPSPTAAAGGLYQPLQPVASTYNNGGVYEPLSQGTRSNDRGPPSRSPNNNPPRSDPTYMGLTPQTRQVNDVYMGLDEARS